MCPHGTTRPLRVPIPADLSHTGQARWAVKPVDACLAPLVAALNAAGILTRSCCCGHGARLPEVMLQDGRTLVVFTDPSEASHAAGLYGPQRSTYP